MNLKRSAKMLALDAVASSAGSNPSLAASLLRGLKVRFGPIPERQSPSPFLLTVDFDVTVPSRFEDNRKGTLALSELARRYAIPITWAVCGASAEADMKSYSVMADASPRGEIGVHTYSHIDAAAASKAQFRDDVERCIQALGLENPRTFVFPWNREAHFDVLKALGFRVFRGKERAVGTPILKGGLWNVRPVYYVDQKSRGAEALMRRYLDINVSLSTPYHLWTHPWALAIGGKTDEMVKTLESLFAYVSEKKGQGLLTTSTLGELATRLDMEATRASERAPEIVQA